jgi:hypothetical protein
MINTKLIITPVTMGCREEFNYLYVWNEPYEIVDASFLIFGFDKQTTLRNLKLFIYKLWYINPEISQDEITEYVVKLLNSKSSSGVFITETDIYNLVYSIFNSDLPKNISDIVKTKDGVNKTTRIIEWKNNLNGLLVINDKRMCEIRESKNISEEINKEYKKIKIKYMKKCLDKVNNENNLKMIESTIDVLREDREFATVKDISDISGLGYNTTKKYIDLMVDRLNFIDGFKVIRNQHKETSDYVLKTLIECKELINQQGIRFNKMSLHKASGISRPTIDKYWEIISK